MERIPQSSLQRVGAERSDGRDKSDFDLVQLLEVIAHDLRNPISGIMAAGQFLQEDAGALLDEHHLALLQSIDSSGRAMLRLIEDALELCSIESGNMRLDIKTTDIKPVLNRALLLSQPHANTKKIQLDVDLGMTASLPPIEIDPARILRAVDSVLSSSIKLARPGSRIEIGAGSRGDHLTIWARTDGFGISTMAMRSLFNPFRKGGRASRPGVEGGIALSLAKVGRIVEAHGGSVRVEGRTGQEMTIKLALPLPSRALVHKGAAVAP